MLNFSVDKMYFIVALGTWPLSLSFMFSLPRRSVWQSEFSIWSISKLSISQILFTRTCLSLKNKEHWRRKWFVSFPQIQISSRQILKLWLNLWHCKWLKPRLILVKSFRISGLEMLKTLLGLRQITFKIFWLKKIDRRSIAESNLNVLITLSGY